MDALIAVLPGDGIGPEVTGGAVQVLEAVAAAGGHRFTFHEARIGGCAIEEDGVPLPEETLALCRRADAVLLGAVGGPRWDRPDAPHRPEQGLLGLRKALNVYANLRPLAVHPALVEASPLRPERVEGVDLLVVRELTGGIYFGEKGRAALPGGGERATDECAYDTAEVERIVRVAASLARERRGVLTSVDKANVLETSRLWREVATRVVRDEYPDVTLDHMLVDACAMMVLRDPRRFDVIVTENMFGDILTDEVSMLAGSLGLLPSASVGDGLERGGRVRGVYEPIHGSAPDIAGQGIANPVGTMLSAAMLLRHSLGLDAEARRVEAAVGEALSGGVRTRDLVASGEPWAGTGEMTEAVLAGLGAPAE